MWCNSECCCTGAIARQSIILPLHRCARAASQMQVGLDSLYLVTWRIEPGCVHCSAALWLFNFLAAFGALLLGSKHVKVSHRLCIAT